MGLTEYRTEPVSNQPVYTFKLEINKEGIIGSYVHPALRRMRFFHHYHGKEIYEAVNMFYKWNTPDFHVIVYVTLRFIQKRLLEIKGIRSKASSTKMYFYALQNFNLLFCRDLFAIIRYKDEYFKFERLENFLSFVFDSSLQSLKDVTLKAYFSSIS